MSSPQTSADLRFLVDENLPRLLTQRLLAEGYAVEDARDVRLRSEPDAVVFAYAQARAETIITLDKGIANIQRHPTPHAGIVAVRVPDRISLAQKVDIIVAGLAGLVGQSLTNAVIVIESGRVRVRR
ncbi:MAG: DUF5615 family PIN-like protein [Ktedonobacterales bacterium]